MTKWLKIFSVLPAILLAQTVHEFARGDEKELKIRLEYGAGKVFLGKSKSDKLARIVTKPDDNRKDKNSDDEIEPRVEFESEGNSAFLNISMDSEGNINFFDAGNQEIHLDVTDKIPSSYKISMGACEGRLDFSNLRVRDLSMELGASSMEVFFNSQNRESINKFKVEAGVSKLDMIGLANANFQRFEFEGGVGQYVLDFSGNLSQNSRARITVGLGKVTIRIPKNLAVRIKAEDSFLSSFRIDEQYFQRRGEDTYYSPDYNSASHRMDMTIEAGLGKMRVEVIE